MNAIVKLKIISLLLLMCFALSSCVSMGFTDAKEKSSWKAPARFGTDAVFNASLKALSQSDLDIVSHDRKAGFISVKHQFPIPLSSIPSEIPLTLIVSKTGDRAVLSTTAYLKGLGTEGAYKDIIKNFYDALFLELNITKSSEKSIIKKSSTSVKSKGKSVKDPKVAEVQKILASKNYSPGPADGLWGNKTASALKVYQSDNNIPVTGKIDDITYDSLKGAK